eukprot:11213293-Karenia_brevis.AAC.1
MMMMMLMMMMMMTMMMMKKNDDNTGLIVGLSWPLRTLTFSATSSGWRGSSLQRRKVQFDIINIIILSMFRFKYVR